MNNNLLNTLLISFLALLCYGCDKPDAGEHKSSKDFGSFKNITGKGKLTSREKDAAARMEKQFAEVEVFPDIKNIIARGALNIGVCEDDCTPFVYRDSEGKLKGLDITISTNLAEDIGVKPKFVCLKDRNELLKKLYYGEIDIAVGEISNTFDRAKYVYFSSTYTTLHQALIFCKKDLLEMDIEDNPYAKLKDKNINIGVLANSSHADYAQSLFPEANLIEYQSRQDIMDALNKHEILLMVDDSNGVALLARKHPEVALSLTIYILTNKKDNIAIAISPTCTNLLSCVNLYIESHDLYLGLNDLIDEFPEVYKCE